MARQPQIRLISLPATNLLLQDAQIGITPRQRGITLVQEARARGIPVLFGSDNVQDPFCHGGSFDPLQAFTLGVYAAQLDDPFDSWSDSICRPGWLSRAPHALPLTKGAPAELVCFEPQPACSWPAWSTSRRILQKGDWREPRQNAIKAH
jgi:cytosine deaminase